MSHKILVIGPAADRQRFLTPDLAQLLSAAGEIHHVDLPAVEETQRAEAFDRTVRDAHALICMPWGRQGLPVFSADRWEMAAKLRVIAGTFDHRFAPAFDVADAHRRGVAVIDTSGSMSLTVAEFALAMIFNLLRDIPDTVAEVRRGGPRGALFVLVGRMWVVEQEALWRRTAAGEIRAAVDVFLPEPPPAGSAFLSDRNVLPTPHVAGNTEQANRRCFTLACTETIAALRGKLFNYAVTVEHAALYAGSTNLKEVSR